MTAHPIDTEALRRLADAATPGPWDYPGELLGSPCTTVFAGDPKRTQAVYLAAAMPENGAFIAAARTAVPALLDLLAAAEHRIARLEAQSDIRGRAVVIYRERAREAEAERDEWRQTALDERAAALDALEQVKVRDARIKAVERLALAADDGTEYEHNGHDPAEGEAECPGCWALGIRRALNGDAQQ